MRGFHRHTARDESGFTLIFVAIFMVAMLVFAALVIDGGNGLSTRRKMQNAADAGAMAGTLALRKAQLAGTATGEGDVNAIVTTLVADNDAGAPSNGTPLCQVVAADAITTIGPCSDSTAVLDASASGVLVNVESNKSTFFGSVANQARQIVRTKAAATIQPIAAGKAPWIVCGLASSGGWDLLDPGTPLPTVNETRAMQDHGWDLTTNSAVPGATPMVIQSNNDPRVRCQAGSSGDGRGDPSGDVVQVGQAFVFDGQPGNGNVVDVPAPVSNVAGGTPCPFGDNVQPSRDIPAGGCDIVLPIADWTTGNGNGSNPYRAHVVAFAAFHIFGQNGNDKVIGYYVGFALSTAGFTDSTRCDTNDLCAVKLRI